MSLPETSETIPPPVIEGRWQRLGRIRRLATKELRETLRDRRTLLTLVLMPFLLYPLFSLVIRKFLLTGPSPGSPVVYSVAFATEDELKLVQQLFAMGRPGVERLNPGQKIPDFSWWVVQRAEEALQVGEIDVVVRVTRFPPNTEQPAINWEIDCELHRLDGSLSGERASRLLEDHLRSAGNRVLAQRLAALGVPQRPSVVRAVRKVLASTEPSAGISLSILVPFVLILMTITGAVYPAIDLTAGERERGTLELLVAAPVPRLGLLIAKYVAVLTVAMLTATINLVAMGATISLSGLGPLLWGEKGISLSAIGAIFGLLFLMASFFAAVLLAITSFARSFKEAQAYLIPVMLSALGPGLVSLMPGIELQGWMLVTPLLNAALLSRDVLAGDGQWLSALVVVISTSLYAFAALAVAAKLFAADAVLYDARLGWGEMWRRPARGSVGLTGALLCLACMFPVSFAALGGISGMTQASMTTRFALMTLATAVVYGGVPFLFALWRRASWQETLHLRRPSWHGLLGATLLGLSLWPFAHELVVLSQKVGLASLDPAQLERAKGLVEQARQVPWWLFLAAISLAPAVFEEFCFRGLVLGAFQGSLRPRYAIFWSGLLFGLFHLVTSDSLAVERLLPSTALGWVLGWVCWRTGSIFPGMALHATHNGFLALVMYYLPELKARGWGIEEQSHLPPLWLAAAAVGLVVGTLGLKFRNSQA